MKKTLLATIAFGTMLLALPAPSSADSVAVSGYGNRSERAGIWGGGWGWNRGWRNPGWGWDWNRRWDGWGPGWGWWGWRW
ncbi:MAG: hypothetical protein PHW76_03645 [Alphaproteobacteria bacterium]|nr:hypothetical protein [Alphaproteobacteria bacterium]